MSGYLETIANHAGRDRSGAQGTRSSTVFGQALVPFLKWATKMLHPATQSYQRLCTERELRALSDAALSDIGIKRSEIEVIAAGVIRERPEKFSICS